MAACQRPGEKEGLPVWLAFVSQFSGITGVGGSSWAPGPPLCPGSWCAWCGLWTINAAPGHVSGRFLLSGHPFRKSWPVRRTRFSGG